MSFLSLTKFVALAGAITTAAVATVQVAPPSENIQSLKNLLNKEGLHCYIVETVSNSQERLLACTNKTYYLHNVTDDSLIELEDLVRVGDNEVSSKLVTKNWTLESRNWTMANATWKKLSSGTTLNMSDIKTSPNGYCSIVSLISDGPTMKRGLSCKSTSNIYGETIELTSL